jgi:hypothetical protein
LLLALSPALVAGEEKEKPQLTTKQERPVLTGNVRLDVIGNPLERTLLTGSTFEKAVVQQTEGDKKSPFLAGAFSLVIPGAGEFYSESYLKSGIFIAAEIALWIVNRIYDKKGDNQTDLFQNFADEHWSVVRYTEWLNKYYNCNIPINPNTNLKPWERVNFALVNECERKVPNFSHTLPTYGDQQYYELIGKYQQYNHGWDDSDPNTDRFYDNLSPNFPFYSQMRGKANDYYNVASTMLTIVVINHILSALDAAWSAVLYNKAHVEVGLRTEPTPFGVILTPEAKVRVTF